MSGHLSDEKTQRRERDRRRYLDQQRVSDLGAVLSTPQGRRFVWDLLANRCLVFSRVPTGPDGIRLEGRRDVGIDLMEYAQANHGRAYLSMVQERFAAEAEDQIHRADARARAETEIFKTEKDL